ncbi:uncharacterized protein LOC117178259 [Belonocnema kinseyi]|uniref:uncharacterized protein LOC117178259 n=1 Tax=Belonocnema kinseyi TaxID=2817044 RepID=UPI00143DD110|nr:uncharacterized protein LOC117178259 [Belonocnema kinseyi]XP_033225501.1 uncharacterized protein LOC117178259 [Belonocnema kinseyi]XP_033225502.1 uncharacterized protein LOC117178259 [Belonocnema kinseyi]
METSEEDVNFIEIELLPELVHERCFCDTGSREFVEYDSASVKPLKSEKGPTNQESYYSADVIVKFSGEPKIFALFIKLLPNSANETAYDWFLNEEIFYNSHLIRKTNMKCVPKCYAVSMGKYGRPVIVLEDLKAKGYEDIKRKLNFEELKLCIDAIGSFHGNIMKYVQEKNSSLNNFSPLKTLEYEEEYRDIFQKGYSRILNLINSSLSKKLNSKLGEDPFKKLKAIITKEQTTICHGHFNQKNLLFKFENGNPIDVKAVRWHTVKYSSIGMDLASLILENISNELESIEKILISYLEAVKSGYPEEERNFLSMTEIRNTFVSNLFYAYFTLSLEEDSSDEKIVELSEQLERLGAFTETQ